MDIETTSKKRCTRCGLDKILDDYHLDGTQGSGRNPRCKKCVSEVNHQRNEQRKGDPEVYAQYRAQRKAYSKNFYSNPVNLENKKEHERDKYHDNAEWREKRRAGTKRWLKARPNYRQKDKLKQYQLTIEQYETMLALQGGLCSICHSVETAKFKGTLKRMSVDHDHITGEVRGLLCNNCNRALGLLKDNVEVLLAASSYLLKTRALSDVDQYQI